MNSDDSCFRYPKLVSDLYIHGDKEYRLWENNWASPIVSPI